MKEKLCHAFQSEWHLISPARQPWNSYMMKVKGPNNMQQSYIMNHNVKIKSCNWEMRMAVGGKGPNNSLKADKSMSIFYNILFILYKSARCWFWCGDLCFWAGSTSLAEIKHKNKNSLFKKQTNCCRKESFCRNTKQIRSFHGKKAAAPGFPTPRVGCEPPPTQKGCVPGVFAQKMMKFHRYSGPFHLLRQATWCNLYQFWLIKKWSTSWGR